MPKKSLYSLAYKRRVVNAYMQLLEEHIPNHLQMNNRRLHIPPHEVKELADGYGISKITLRVWLEDLEPEFFKETKR